MAAPSTSGCAVLLLLALCVSAVTAFVLTGEPTATLMTDGAGSSGRALWTVDLNHDDRLDFVVLDDGYLAVHVAVGDSLYSELSYERRLLYSVPTYETDYVLGLDKVSIADATGDGLPDILVVVAESVDSSVDLYVNDGTGRFNRAVVSLPGVLLRAGRLADVTGDGIADLVIVGDGLLAVTPSQAPAGVMSPHPFPVAAMEVLPLSPAMTLVCPPDPANFMVDCQYIALADGDVDGDGAVDIVISFGWGNIGDAFDNPTETTLPIALLRGRGARGEPGARFAAPEFVLPSRDRNTVPFVQLLDIDADGRLDLMFCNASTVAFLLNTGNASAALHGGSTVALHGLTLPWGRSGAVARSTDLNRDGRPDLVVATPTQLLSCIAPSTAGALRTAGFTCSTLQNYSAPMFASAPVAMTLADLDGHGRNDLVIKRTNMNLFAATSGVVVGVPAAVALEAALSGATLSPPVVVDLNNDGYGDLVFLALLSSPTRVEARTILGAAPTTSNAPRFQTTSQLIGDVGLTQATLCSVTTPDLNGDGRPDVLLTIFPTSAYWFASTGGSGGTVTFDPTRRELNNFLVSPPLALAGRVRSLTAPLDVLLVDSNTRKLQWRENDGSGTFATRVWATAGSWHWSFALHDMDGDGLDDFFIFASTYTAVFINTPETLANGSFMTLDMPGLEAAAAMIWFHAEGERVVDHAFVEMDADGTRDLIVLTASGVVKWVSGAATAERLRAIADGQPAASSVVNPTVAFACPADGGTWLSSKYFFSRMAAGDVNGDGLPDVVVTCLSGNAATEPFNPIVNYSTPLLLRNVGGAFASAAPLWASSTGPAPRTKAMLASVLHVSDLAQRGVADVVVMSLGSGMFVAPAARIEVRFFQPGTQADPTSVVKGRFGVPVDAGATEPLEPVLRRFCAMAAGGTVRVSIQASVWPFPTTSTTLDSLAWPFLRGCTVAFVGESFPSSSPTLQWLCGAMPHGTCLRVRNLSRGRGVLLHGALVSSFQAANVTESRDAAVVVDQRASFQSRGYGILSIIESAITMLANAPADGSVPVAAALRLASPLVLRIEGGYMPIATNVAASLLITAAVRGFIREVYFTDNDVVHGAIALVDPTGSAYVVVQGGRIERNAGNSAGGAALVLGGTLVLTGTSIKQNEAAVGGAVFQQAGGALWVPTGGNATSSALPTVPVGTTSRVELRDCQVLENIARIEGGALYVLSATQGPRLTGTTALADNALRTTGMGAEIYFFSDGARPTVGASSSVRGLFGADALARQPSPGIVGSRLSRMQIDYSSTSAESDSQKPFQARLLLTDEFGHAPPDDVNVSPLAVCVASLLSAPSAASLSDSVAPLTSVGVCDFRTLTLTAPPGSSASVLFSALPYSTGLAGGAAAALPTLSVSLASFYVKMCAPGTHIFNSLQCSPCAAGTYSNTSNAAVCEPCPAGHASAGPTGCAPCEPGTYIPPGTTASQCAACPAGAVQPSSGATECHACPAGHAYVGTTDCTPCAPGTFMPPGTSAPQCTECAAGTVQPASNATSCYACPAGHAYIGGTGCAPCEPGTFMPPGVSASQCTQCPAGTFQPSSGMTSCLPCAAGSASSNGAANCTLCPVGAYAGSPGLPACAPCALGTMALLPGSTTCRECTAGLNCAILTPARLPGAQRGYWVNTTALAAGVVHVARCPTGWCAGMDAAAASSSTLNVCREGHLPSAAMCGACDEAAGYRMWDGACQRCFANQQDGAVGGGGGLVFLYIGQALYVVYALFFDPALRSTGIPATVIFFVQTLGLIAASFTPPPPAPPNGTAPAFEPATWINVANFEVAFNQCPQAVLAGVADDGPTFYAYFWFKLAQPLVMLALLGAVALIATPFERRRARAGAAAAASAWWQRALDMVRDTAPLRLRVVKSVLLVLLFSFTPVARTLLATVHCIDVFPGDLGANVDDAAPSTRVLAADPTISCDDPLYGSYRALAIALLVFLGAFPVTLFAVVTLLERRRRRAGAHAAAASISMVPLQGSAPSLSPEADAKQPSALHQQCGMVLVPFRAGRTWWWLVMELRKLAVLLIVTFTGAFNLPLEQLLLGALLLLIAFASYRSSPFVSRLALTLDMASMLLVVFTLLHAEPQRTGHAFIYVSFSLFLFAIAVELALVAWQRRARARFVTEQYA